MLNPCQACFVLEAQWTYEINPKNPHKATMHQNVDGTTQLTKEPPVRPRSQFLNHKGQQPVAEQRQVQTKYKFLQDGTLPASRRL